MNPKQSGWDKFYERMLLNDVFHCDEDVPHEIHHAFLLAEMAHAGQTRREWDESNLPVPYFEHPKRAVYILTEELGIRSISLISALLLHDTLEDTTVTERLIYDCLGVYITLMVTGLTQGSDKEQYIQSFMTTERWEIPLLKGCDRLDNLRALSKAKSEKFLRKKLEETYKYLPAFERVVEIAPDYYQKPAARLVELIKDELDALSAGVTADSKPPQRPEMRS